MNRDGIHQLPFDDEQVDVVLSFYSLEHLHPLSTAVDEMIRVLRPGGALVGAIPAEGGLAWGFGRYLTSRRWLKRNTKIDPDKIICWEHPNFAEHVLQQLDNHLIRERLSFWPWKLPLVDVSLVISFVYRKAEVEQKRVMQAT